MSKAAVIRTDMSFDPEPVIASSNVAVAALAVGLSRGAYEYARDYAKEREAFGGPIAQKQSIAFMLAEMATEIEAIRLRAHRLTVVRRGAVISRSPAITHSLSRESGAKSLNEAHIAESRP